MAEKQGPFAAYRETARKSGDKKDLRLRINFVDLTLLKADFEELFQLLQNHLQDVEIFIDDQRIFENTQLRQFTEDYQAKILLVRGYWSENIKEHSEEQETRLLVELAVTKLLAVLLSWKSLEKSEFIIKLKKLLLRRVTKAQNFVQGALLIALLSPGFTITTIIFHHPFDSIPHILQVILDCIVCILSIPVFFLVFMRLLTWLKLDTRNLLFPGKAVGTRTYQRTASIVRILIALVLMILFDGVLIGGSIILARIWY